VSRRGKRASIGLAPRTRQRPAGRFDAEVIVVLAVHGGPDKPTF
jgi:hypothetical protein